MESQTAPLDRLEPGVKIPTESAEDLFRQVYSSSASERRAAEQLLLDGKPERTDALIQVVARENRKKTRRFALFAGLFTAALVALIVLLEFGLSGRANIGGFGYPLWMAAAGAAAYFAPTRLQKHAARALAASDDIRAVPLLIDALDKQDAATRTEALKALTRILPRLRADHDRLLDDSQLTILRNQMGKGDSKPFTIAALKAVQQIGDERFLDSVKAWAAGKGIAKKSPLLRDEAKACLPFLEERVERLKVGKTLLRAASANAVDDEALLRPAVSTSSDNEDLLRPALSAAGCDTAALLLPEQKETAVSLVNNSNEACS